jgi:hypothetical protein
MNRYRGRIRAIMCYSWCLIMLAAVFSSIDGVFGLGIGASRILVRVLWVTCFASATLVMVFDGVARIVAAIVLLSLFLLFLPTL